MNGTPDPLLGELRSLGLTVTDSYPYAAVLGAWLQADEPGWLAEFTAAEPQTAALPLAQARNYAFLAFCERNPSRHDRLDAHMTRYLRDGARHLHAELANTVDWYRRHG